ncbi:glycosyl transferase family 2 [Bacillus methanolicus PB1]|uniref:Glycosyl transferase family 2 n=1 Tax=Bacillus methanolicus PB1 TaxID=997296 RepID=I3DUW6_BACMT|nr:glycosyltransferase [Bacillus methanolicus]EIJ78037.1 glycosyl transferase family 2 [Bacillus methanolicus PB1]
MKKPVISLCMIVKNEADCLPRCLQSVKDIADEIIIVDTGSTDETVKVAKNFGAQVIMAPWQGDFSQARNAGLNRARGTWILFLDADEELDADDKEQLRICSEHLEFEGFFLQVHNHSGETLHSPTATVNPILRMFRNRPEYRFRGYIHEQIVSSILDRQPNAAFHITAVKIHHYGYAGTAVANKDKIRRNLQLLEKALAEHPNDPFHHYNIAVEYMRMNDWYAALQHLRESLSVVPPGTSYIHLLYKYIARCHFHLGNNREAIEACDQGITFFPDYTDLYHLKGTVLLASNLKQEAKETYLIALQKGPAPLIYHTDAGTGTYLSAFALGQICEELGDDRSAIHWYGEAIRHHPRWAAPLMKIIRVMKCAHQENELPELLIKRFLPHWKEATMLVVKALIEENCFLAASVLEASISKHSISATKSDNTSDGSGVMFPVIETDLVIKDALLNRETGKALKLLKPWLSNPLSSPDTLTEEAYRKSRTLLSMADAHLHHVTHSSPRFSVYRRARYTLPLPKLEF